MNPNPILGRAGEEMLRRFAQFRPRPDVSSGAPPFIPGASQASPNTLNPTASPVAMIADLVRQSLFAPPEEPVRTEDGTVFSRGGKLLIDIDSRQWRDGTTSTHDIYALPDEVQRGDMSVRQYEDLVLTKPRTLFSQDVERVNNSLDTLEPDTVSRFEQLREAASREGINLRVNETRRSQERQEWLFQQGRSRPGQIVTWTLTSDHRDGRALDVRAPNQRGYQWLWENAERYGFRSMGARDPGHIYVPRGEGRQRPADFGDVSSGSSSRRVRSPRSHKQMQP